MILFVVCIFGSEFHSFTANLSIWRLKTMVTVFCGVFFIDYIQLDNHHPLLLYDYHDQLKCT